MTNIIAENNKKTIIIRVQCIVGLTVGRTDIKRRKQAGGGICVYRDCLLLSIQ